VGDTEAVDINDNGVVCGMGNYVVNVSVTPFRYDGTTVTELPLLPGADLPIALTTGINAAGVICGYSHNADGDSQACYWDGTDIYTIPYPPDASPDADIRAYDINDNGVIVGYYWQPGSVRTAFYHKIGDDYSTSLDAAIRGTGVLFGLQLASGVNNSDVICGVADDASAITTSYTYDIDTGVVTVIGRIGLANCSATDINDAGQTIGRGKYYDWDTYFRAVTYDGTWHFADDAEPAHQRVGGINNAGRIVAYSGSASTRTSWYSDAPGPGSRIYLDLPGWVSANAHSINNNDWIVGYGDAPAAGDDTRGFIIKPPPGDADHDADLDMYDFGALQVCFTASGPVQSGCETFDFEPDGDVDLDDFAAFQAAFEGP
jgi:uncharacterized membrane protein